MRYRITVVLYLLAGLFSVFGTEQRAARASYWVVKLKSGSVVCGRRESENASVLVLDIDGFTQSILKNTIASIDSGSAATVQQSNEATESVTSPPRMQPPSVPSPVATGSPASPSSVAVAPKAAGVTNAKVATGDKPPVIVRPLYQEKIIPPLRKSATAETEAAVSASSPEETPVASVPVMPRRVKAEIVPFEKNNPLDAGASSNAAAPAAEMGVPAPPPVDRQTGLPRPRVNLVTVSGDAASSFTDEVQKQTGTTEYTPALTQKIVNDTGKPPAADVTGFSGEIRVIPAPRSAFYAQQTQPAIPAAPEKTASAGDRTKENLVGTPASSPVIQPIQPLAMTTPAPLPAHAAKNRTVSIVNHERQAEISAAKAASGSAHPFPIPPMAPLPVRGQRKLRSDGMQELVLADGTVFIGKVTSQTERVIIFTSDGASITIFKGLVKSIDGEPYRFAELSRADSLRLKDGYVTQVASSQQTRKTAPARALFRILPRPEIPPGTTAAMLADSMQHAAEWKCRSRAARRLGAMGTWGGAAIQPAVRLLSDTSQCNIAVPAWIDSLTVDILLPPALEAARALSQMGAQGEAELLQALRSENPFIRRNAVFGLGNCFHESAEKAVKDALRDPDPSVRQATLGSLRVSTSLPLLFAALQDPDGSVRATSVLLLGKLNDRSVAERLAPLAKDGNREVRRAVAKALGSLGVPEAVPTLIQLCKDSDNFVRASAIKALGKTKDGNAVPTLISALKDPTADVRAEAVEALGIVRDSRSIPSLYAVMKDRNESVRKKAQAAIRQLTEIPLLIAALDDESTTVRANTAYVLWLMTGQDLGTDRTKWEAWATRKGRDGERVE